MILGADTSFLVTLEIREAAHHLQVRDFLTRTILQANNSLALAPQVMAEFIHVVTDPHRFQKPLSMEEALRKVELWWNAEEVHPVFPDIGTLTLFTHWMYRYRPGRKRILGTLLAATYVTAGVRCIVSSDARDYRIFEGLEVVDPATGGRE
jgi:predicted nucleic acid-binding protein